MPFVSLQPGSRLGKYELLAHVATGGMGTVFKAVDQELDRVVALKVLPSEMAANSVLLDRFRREARYAARLSHPNIVTLYECGHDPVLDLHYLAMEFVDGIDLGKYIERRGQLDPDEARRILVHAAMALGHAYQSGVVHRDIKPSNFLLAQVDHKAVVKLTDLGLARMESDDTFRMTRDGSTVGTIDYLSPEQARDSSAADIRSDIYSLGCTAYHMLAGKPPFAEGGLGERVYKHLETPPPDIRQFNPAVSAEFWNLLQRMLAKRPEDRPASPHALTVELKRVRAVATPAERAGGTEPPSRPAVPPMITATPETPSPADEPSVADPPKRKRRPKPAAAQPTPPSPPAIPVEQARSAELFHERTREVLKQGGGLDYARQLLNSCLEIDPFNPAYHQTLRELNRQELRASSKWFQSLNLLASKSKMRVAASRGQWRKVLEHGEETVTHRPSDTDAHLELARAAEQLGQMKLAIWYLQQGLVEVPEDDALMQAVARLYELRHEWKLAVTIWQRICELRPDDSAARRKMNELYAREHMATGHYRR